MLIGRSSGGVHAGSAVTLVLQSRHGNLAEDEVGMKLKLEDIMAAGIRIKRHIHRTPLLQSRCLSEMMGCELYIKPEFLQKTGSFKARGALNFTLTDDSEGVPFTHLQLGQPRSGPGLGGGAPEPAGRDLHAGGRQPRQGGRRQGLRRRGALRRPQQRRSLRGLYRLGPERGCAGGAALRS